MEYRVVSYVKKNMELAYKKVNDDMLVDIKEYVVKGDISIFKSEKDFIKKYNEYIKIYYKLVAKLIRDSNLKLKEYEQLGLVKENEIIIFRNYAKKYYNENLNKKLELIKKYYPKDKNRISNIKERIKNNEVVKNNECTEKEIDENIKILSVNTLLDELIKHSYEEYENAVFTDCGAYDKTHMRINICDYKKNPLLNKIIDENLLTNGYLYTDLDDTEVAELLGIFLALNYSVLNDKKIIYCDNIYAINKYDTLENEPLKESIKEIQNRFIRFKREFKKLGGKVEYIRGCDNPADFGYHKEY